MAQHVEPMDIDSSVCEFDNKENSLHHNNVLSRTPCMEKGYEELDVSELNMKLRYSMTPVSSPMSKSYTANCIDNRNTESDSTLNCENGNMTRSLHSTMKNESSKPQKNLPLQTLSAERGQGTDGNRNALMPLDTTTTLDNNVTVTVSGPNDIDENISLPSLSSSLAHTPEATTPTKELPKGDASPIMRGLKSVLNMFRPSQSPIPPEEEAKTETFSPPIVISPDTSERSQTVSASTPLSQRTKDPLTKRNSLNQDNLVFNEDLEKELQWKDDSTIIFSKEKIPIHKLFFQHSKTDGKFTDFPQAEAKNKDNDILDATVEYMDISYKDCDVSDMNTSVKTAEPLNKNSTTNVESDSEFLDCETSFKSQEEVYPTKEIHHESIQDTEAPENLNDTMETLNNRSIDLSDASTKTATANLDKSENSKLVSDEYEENLNDLTGNKKSDHCVELPKETQVIEKEVHPDPENVQVLSRENTEVQAEINASKGGILKNIETFVNNLSSSKTSENVISTIGQIPLIVDPKVLLFSIPTESTVEELTTNVADNLISPTDMPLPDDEEFDSLSIPLSNAPIDMPKNIETNKTQVIEEKLNTVLTEKPEEISNQIDLTKAVAVNKDTFIKSTLSNENIPLLNANKSINLDTTNALYDNEILSQTVTQNSTIIQSIDELINEIDFNKSPVLNTVQPELKCSESEPMDISMAEVSTLPINQGGVVNDEQLILESTIADVINGNVSTPEFAVVPELLFVTTGEDTNTSQMLNHKENETPKPSTENILETANMATNDPQYEIKEQTIESEMVKNIGSNIESIKQEVEAIVATAMNIVAIKENELKSETSNISQGVFETNLGADTIYIPTDINKITAEVEAETIQPKISDAIPEQSQVEDLNDHIKQDTVIISLTDKVKVNEFIESSLKDANENRDQQSENDPATTPVGDQKLLNTTELCTETKQASDKLELATKPRDIPNTENVSTATETPIEKQMQITELTSSQKESSSLKEERAVEQEDPQKIAEIADFDEIVTSENSSPFLLVSSEVETADDAELQNFEEVVNPIATNSRVLISPPSSPIIVSKGYNFNFDEIEDPFATKTKIRQSPPPGVSPNHSFENVEAERELPKKVINKNIRRKSQPERKPIRNEKTKKLNSTFVEKSKQIPKTEIMLPSDQQDFLEQKVNLKQEIPDIVMERNVAEKDEIAEKTKTDAVSAIVTSDTAVTELGVEPENCSSTGHASEVMDQKKEPSSEQLTHFSADISFNEDIKIKSAFNLPEMSDPNFNPFASKSNIPSTPPDVNIDPFATKSKIPQSPPPSCVVIDQHLRSTNDSNVTVPVSSTIVEQNTESRSADITVNIETSEAKSESFENNGDKLDTTSDEKTFSNNSVSTVKTEDADTIEGPFLEAEDISDDKMSDFDGENVDMLHFTELPPSNEEPNDAGEMFIDAEAFEYLLNRNQACSVADSGKESLFLKFDPLFAKRISSEGVMAALNKVQKRESTPKKMAIPQPDATFDKSIAGPSTMNVTNDIDISNVTEDSCDDLNITVSKPMMVVNPAVNPVVTPRNKTTTPVRANRQSLTFTSPAIAVIDRLLCMSANNSLVSHDSSIAEHRRDNEADLALTQLRELLADKEISVYNLRSESKELKDRLANLESQMKNLEAIGEERLKKINELNETLTEKTKMNKSMAKVVEEYERTIASLIAETEQDRKRHAEERIQLIKERDEQTAHLTSMEVSFSDLHSKYEKSKQVILGFKANEDSYKKSIKEFEENFAKMQKNYELLKQHATSKLTYANEELQKINRAHESEVLKLNALIKRKDLHITSLEETLQQKTKANEELTAICDELINKVG